MTSRQPVSDLDCCDPVGILEIATLLGVSRATVQQWRYLSARPPAERPSDPLPDEEWSISDRPVWQRATIVAWAERTGRTVTA